MKKVNLSQLAAEIVDNFRHKAKVKNVNFHLKLHKKIHLQANEGGISILIRNIIYNAINYSYNGGMINVKVATSNNKILLSVRDNGPGIAPDKHKTALNRFQKIHNGNSSGSGLGLSIVKRICDLHHAKLELGRPQNSNGLEVSVLFNPTLSDA